MIIGATGHRPNKLPDSFGYSIPNPTYDYICQMTEKYLRKFQPEKTISGLALGYNSYFANISYKLGIPFIAAIPFEGQECRWNKLDIKRYYSLLKKACEVVYVSSPGYSAEKMQLRNEYIVKNSDLILACWNGSPSGTANCIKFAQSLKKEIVIIDPLAAP